MSQLIIADLNFCDSEAPNKNEIKGGKRKFGKKFSASKVNAAYSASWDAGYTVGPGGAAAAAAAGTAAAVSLGGDADADTDANVDVKA